MTMRSSASSRRSSLHPTGIACLSSSRRIARQ
jgi:hypothetical protein